MAYQIAGADSKGCAVLEIATFYVKPAFSKGLVPLLRLSMALEYRYLQRIWKTEGKGCFDYQTYVGISVD